MNNSIIHIDHDSMTPKYKQIIDSIHGALQNKELKTGQKIPSINEIANKNALSRDTVLTAFNNLLSRGVITSRPGKGYYVRKSNIHQQRKIFLLFDKLTSYKEVLYDSFISTLNKKDKVEMFFHNFNTALFESLIRENVGSYTDYVVMPIPTKTITPALELIPKDKLYILDRGRKLYGRKYSSVCQNFKDDILNALNSGIDLIKKYKTFYMVTPGHSHYPKTLVKGFREFCTENKIVHDVAKKIPEDKVRKACAYLVIDDHNLVKIVRSAAAQSFEIGKDVGIISYNDSPLKSIIVNGITTISTDFELMGKNMAELIMNKSKEHIDNPSSLIMRASL